MPLARLKSSGRQPVARRSLRLACVFGPVALATVVAIVIALRALPLAGAPRLVLAAAVGLDVWLLALASWSGILGVLAGRRIRAGHKTT